MTHITKITAAFLIAATSLLGGCADKNQEIDLSLIGGEIDNADSDFTVDIRQETTETPVDSDHIITSENIEPELITEPETAPEDIAEYDIPKEETTAPETTTAASKKQPTVTTAKQTTPAVTITTNKPKETTPAQTVRTDLPKVTAEPQYTTAATTTTKPAKQNEPVEIETDSNGFPANPVANQYFVDNSGQEYIYDTIFGWIKGNNGSPTVQEFPDNYGEIGTGEKILH